MRRRSPRQRQPTLHGTQAGCIFNTERDLLDSMIERQVLELGAQHGPEVCSARARRCEPQLEFGNPAPRAASSVRGGLPRITVRTQDNRIRREIGGKFRMTEDPARDPYPFALRLERCDELVNQFATGNEQGVETAGWAIKGLDELDWLLHAKRNKRLRDTTERLIQPHQRVTEVAPTDQRALVTDGDACLVGLAWLIEERLGARFVFPAPPPSSFRTRRAARTMAAELDSCDSVRAMRIAARQTGRNAFATHALQLADRPNLDRMQRLDRLGRNAQGLDRQRIQRVCLATRWNRVDLLGLDSVGLGLLGMALNSVTRGGRAGGRIPSIPSQRDRSADRRSRRQPRLESAACERLGDASHECLLCSVRHPEQRRTSREIAEQAIPDEILRLVFASPSIGRRNAIKRHARNPALKASCEPPKHGVQSTRVGPQHKRRTT